MGAPLTRFDHPPDSGDVTAYIDKLSKSGYINHNLFDFDDKGIYLWDDLEEYRFIDGGICRDNWLRLIGSEPPYSFPPSRR